MTDRWVPHDERDQVVDFVHRLSEKTEVPLVKFVEWLGIARAKFYEWRRRYGQANEHNGKIPRDHWIEPWERQAIVEYFDTHPLEGYRRLTFMMLDDLAGLTHVRTSVNYPQANGKIERYHRTLDKDTIHAVTPDGAHATIAARIDHYNYHRLHSAIGYVSPRDKLLGRETEIWAGRDRKLEAARELRRKRRELAQFGTAA